MTAWSILVLLPYLNHRTTRTCVTQREAPTISCVKLSVRIVNIEHKINGCPAWVVTYSVSSFPPEIAGAECHQTDFIAGIKVLNNNYGGTLSS